MGRKLEELIKDLNCHIQNEIDRLAEKGVVENNVFSPRSYESGKPRFYSVQKRYEIYGLTIFSGVSALFKVRQIAHKGKLVYESVDTQIVIFNYGDWLSELGFCEKTGHVTWQDL